MKYLVIETKSLDGKDFIHFVELKKDVVEHDIVSLFNHVKSWHENVVKVYFSNERVGNW